MTRVQRTASRLDAIIQFAKKEKKKDPPSVAQGKLGGMLLGGYLGAYGGLLRGVETGSLASGVEGVRQTVKKARNYAQEDAAHEALKDSERYIEIEDKHGRRIKALRGPSSAPKAPMMDRIKATGQKAARSAREGLTKARFATEDALHGTKKWLTRSSLSRSATIGAVAGGTIGRYLGGKAGEVEHRSKLDSQARARKAKIRKQERELAKNEIMAKTIADSINQRRLSSLLDQIIQFDAPPIDSYNPIKRYRQHQDLQKWVDERPPSAGITAEDLNKQYPEDKARTSKRQKGALIGAGAGLVGGALLGRGLSKRSLDIDAKVYAPVIGGLYGGVVGAGAGAGIADYKHQKKRFKENAEAYKHLVSEITGPKAVPAESIKTDVPRATSYREVTGALKEQGVGPIARHVTAAATRPSVWEGDNAFFVPRGKKGLVVTSGKIHPAVFAHEAGHAKDYAHYGGEQGFRKAYPKYGDPFASREQRISNTMLAEHRAWAYAKPRKKDDKKLRDSALTSYRTGLDLAAKLDWLIEFGEEKKKAVEPTEKGSKRSRALDAAALGTVGGVYGGLGGAASGYILDGRHAKGRKGGWDLFKGFRPGGATPPPDIDYGNTLGEMMNRGAADEWKERGLQNDPTEAFQKGPLTKAELDARRTVQKKYQYIKKATRRGLIGAGIGAAALGAPALFIKPHEKGEGMESEGIKKGKRTGATLGAYAGLLGGGFAAVKSRSPVPLAIGTIGGSAVGNIIGGRVGGAIGSRIKKKPVSETKQLSARLDHLIIL